MCGRYYVDESTEKKVQEMTHNKDVKLKIGDIHPEEEATVLNLNGSDLAAEDMVWGFPNIIGGRRIINARAETVTELRTFKTDVSERRCIIPAKGFYEWSPDKEKYNFEEPGQTLFLAGCYSPENRFVIITTAANDSVLPVHPRMPLLLTEDEIEQWLADTGYMQKILKQTPEALKRWTGTDQGAQP